MIDVIALLVVLVGGSVLGVRLRREGGTAIGNEASAAETGERAELLAAAGVTGSCAPTVLRLSTQSCVPCGEVRRVVTEVVDDLAEEPRPPVHIGVDVEADPELVAALNVVSLPTTFVFDADDRERFRISGVPRVEDLRTALAPLVSASSGNNRR